VDQSTIINQQMKGKEEFMCPACMASAAVMAGSVMSTGGIAALAVRIVRRKEEWVAKEFKEHDGEEKRRWQP
jgi:hypothetical protein